MPALTSVKYSNKKVKKIVTVSVIAVILVVAAVFGVKLLLDNGVFSKKEDTAGNSFAMTDEMSQTVSESDLHKGYMFSRVTKILSEDPKMSPWILSWYVLPGTTRSVPEMQSAYVDTFDQILLLESYVREGKRSSAKTMIDAIDKSLTDESGYLLKFKKADELISEDQRPQVEKNDIFEDQSNLLLSDPPVSMEATTRYLRVLLDYYDKWGDSKLLTRIENLAKMIFDAGSKSSYRAADRAAKPTPIPVTEKTLVPEDFEEEPEPEGNTLVSVSGVEICAMDLDAMRRATVLLPEYKEKYEDMIRIVKEGKISSEFPLYAWMYSEEAGYTYYTGSAGDVELVPSLYAMVHLAEIGQMDEDGYAWVSSEIYNSGFLYTSYNMMSGAPSETEASEAYPLVLYLAVIKGDNDLFAATYNAMMRNYATLDTSVALYDFFRNADDSRIAVYARENLLMELILR